MFLSLSLVISVILLYTNKVESDNSGEIICKEYCHTMPGTVLRLIICLFPLISKIINDDPVGKITVHFNINHLFHSLSVSFVMFI